MNKIIKLVVKLLVFVSWYIAFFSVVHFGLVSIIFWVFGKNTATSNLLSGLFDIIAVGGGLLFALHQIIRKSDSNKKVLNQKSKDVKKQGFVFSENEAIQSKHKLIKLTKSTKIGIIGGILLVVSLVVYCFMIFLPKNNIDLQTKVIDSDSTKLSENISNEERCMDAGQKAYEIDKKIYGDETSEPRFTFSKKLDTCVYSGSYHHNNPRAKQCGDIIKYDCNAHWEKWVKNSFTNEKIIHISNFVDKNGNWTVSSEEIINYERKELELFNKNFDDIIKEKIK